MTADNLKNDTSKARSEVQSDTWQSLANAIRNHYQVAESDFVPLHAPCFDKTEKELLNACIDSTFVSSVGEFVGAFEEQIADFTGAKHAVAVVNGTMGLFLGLKVVGVKAGDLVLTQSLTFVATPNAIKMLGADPVFVDVSLKTMGLSAEALAEFLSTQTYQQNGKCFHKASHRLISACAPMHTLGFPMEIEQVVSLCHEYGIKVVEDAAESLGSFVNGVHTGTFGDVGVFSFNGNKVITTGGGGMLVTNNTDIAAHAKHLSTTAKIPHQWLFEHDEIGYNLRMPNLNAALGVAQMKKLPSFLAEKHQLALQYQDWVSSTQLSGNPNLVDFGADYRQNFPDNLPNYWLNACVLNSNEDRDAFLSEFNGANLQTRPLWTPMHRLEIYQNELRGDMTYTEFFAERVVNVPSGVICPPPVELAL
jgi:aminotransferase in exopolysaccharide biosynthesis